MDADLFAGNDNWKKNVLPKLKNWFAYTKWQDGRNPCAHAGRRITQQAEKKSTDYVKLDQKDLHSD